MVLDTNLIKKVTWLIVEFLVVCVIIVLWNWAFHNPMCNFMFKCGCTWNWSGGWDECNIHSTDPAVPHCPLCSAPPSTAWITQWGVMGSMFVSYYLIAYWKTIKTLFIKSEQGKRKMECIIDLNIINILSRIIIPGIAFFISSIIIGFGFYLSSDYPTFLF